MQNHIVPSAAKPMDRRGADLAQRARSVLGASGTADIVDAHVVVRARRYDRPVVTTDPNDLKRSDPAARLVAI